MSDGESESDSENEPLSILQQRLKGNTVECDSQEFSPDWGKHVRFDSPAVFNEKTGIPDQILSSNPSPMSLFSLFFDKNIIEKLVFETNLYAQQEQIQTGKPFSKTTFNEMSAFLGINLLIGIKRMPSYKDYWSSSPDLHDSYISSLMSQKRFGWLLGHFHINDNSLMANRNSPDFDRLYKVRPVLDHLGKAFAKSLLPSEVLALDESMIKFKGRSTLKQYMPKKPIKRL